MAKSIEITKVFMFVEVDGRPHLVNLPEQSMMLLVNLASKLSETGALPLLKLPDGFELTTIGELDKEELH